MNLRRSKLLDAQLREPLAHINAGLERLALNKASQESTSKGIASTVGVVDLGRLDGVDRELLDLILALNGDQGGVSALSDNSDTLSLAVLLGKVGEVLGDILGLLGRQVVGLSVSSSLGLVANDVVPVRSASINDVLEELGNERSGERQNKRLVVLGSLLSKLHDGRGADCLF